MKDHKRGANATTLKESVSVAPPTLKGFIWRDDVA